MRLFAPDAPAAFVAVEFNRVTPRYFQAASIPVLKGRVFQDTDAPTSNAVVLDELAARQLFGDRDPLGVEVTNGYTRFSIVGVVSNVRMRGPEADTSPQAYLHGPAQAGSYSYIVRTSQPVTTVIPALQTAIASLRPDGSAPAQVRRVEDAFRNITARRRFSAGTMAIFGVLALVIGAAGVYGVMSSLVAQRTREIGVRLALGATGSQIVRGVLSQMGRHVAIGLVIGLLIAWLASKTFATFFLLNPTDVWIYFAVAIILAAVGLAAAFLPARRASRVDPLLALRTE
jgi:ABC-type antimicrobial peptide transport system permease subunit